MSQRGRPGSSQSKEDAQRMPFAAAEALHWGRETWNQHNQLFGRMGELEERYGVHDRRIQVTEAIAEAAEAATARIRRIEQQVAAIESDEHDRPFDKWAQEEIASFKGFIEKNKSVRQKQVELDKQVSNLEDSFDKVKDAPRDLDILLHRIGRLEQDRMHDADRIQRLETDMTALISSWQTKATEINRPRPDSPRKQTPRHMMPAPPRPQAEALEIEEDTEDEETLIPPPVEQPVQAQIQVRQSPKISSDRIVITSPTKAQNQMSARLRMMQRKSIHEPKQTKDNEQLQPQALQSKPSRSRFDPPPATQIIDRPAAGRSALTREFASPTPERLPTQQLIVKLKTSHRKRKLDSNIPIPRVTRSQGKRDKEAAQAQSAVLPPKIVTAPAETQVVNEPAAKRRKPNKAPNPPQARPKAKKGLKKTVPPSPKAADLVKTSSRKTAASTKLVNPSQYRIQPATSVPTGQRKKVTAKPSASTALHQPDSGFGNHHENIESSAKPARLSSPKKSTTASKSTQRKNPGAAANSGPSATPMMLGIPSSPHSGPSAAAESGSRHGRGVVGMLETPDWQTFDKIERNNLVI